MKKCEIEYVILLRVAENLNIGINEVERALKGSEKLPKVLGELEKQQKMYAKAVDDLIKMSRSNSRATPIILEYGKSQKYLDVINELIINGNKKIKKVR